MIDPTPLSPPVQALCNKMAWSREGEIVVANRLSPRDSPGDIHIKSLRD